MPRLWTDTVEAHRREVRDAIVDAAASLASARGVRGVTMTDVAHEAGIGRATLYKYFPDVESILVAWHDRQISGHVEHLTELADPPGTAGERLEAVLTAYARIVHESRDHRNTELAAFLHRDERIRGPRERLGALVRDLLTEAAAAGEVRDDVPAGELAIYCLHAVGAASTLRSRAAVRRLVTVTLDGLR
ncbi:MAG: TetR/AcrR family transcriptional regulator [Actinomycetota bacterium]|nr:TetR/AcrR family transcriptional regulator [Actinomycetota bacterium]